MTKYERKEYAKEMQKAENNERVEKSKQTEERKK
jgi:hypothetical protein